jgi:hypothetical protein
MKKKLTVIVNLSLKYTFLAKNRADAIEQAENIELPANYVEDSFEVFEVLDKNGEKVEVEEGEESCIKCGKIISIAESDENGGQCATCWHERNQ